MKLTRNEKKTLSFLLDDGKISDTEIATKLNITKQAVGKIRRKLETSGIILSYNVKLDYERLGIHAFAITTAVLSKDGTRKGDLDVENRILNNPHIIQAFRVPSGDTTHILIYAFKNLDELTNYFHRQQEDYLDTKQIHVCSHIGFIKDNPNSILKKIITETQANKFKHRFSEIDRFKKNLDEDGFTDSRI